MPDGYPFVLGSQNNTASLETVLVRSGGFLQSAFHVENGVGGAILGRSQGGPIFPLPPASFTARATPPVLTYPFGVWGRLRKRLGRARL